MRQWEVLKILVKRGRCGANDVEAILGNRNAGDHSRLLTLIAWWGWLKGLFLLFDVFAYECTGLHVSFEVRTWAPLVIAVLFLVTPFCIMSFDAAEETKAFFITPFLFFFRDFASLGLEVSIVNRRPILDRKSTRLNSSHSS